MDADLDADDLLCVALLTGSIQPLTEDERAAVDALVESGLLAPARGGTYRLTDEGWKRAWAEDQAPKRS